MVRNYKQSNKPRILIHYKFRLVFWDEGFFSNVTKLTNPPNRDGIIELTITGGQGISRRIKIHPVYF